VSGPEGMFTGSVLGPLPGNWTRGAFAVVQLAHLQFSGCSFAEALARLDSVLYRHEKEKGVILLSPLAIEHGYGVNVMAIAATLDRAKSLTRQATRRLIGSSG